MSTLYAMALEGLAMNFGRMTQEEYHSRYIDILRGENIQLRQRCEALEEQVRAYEELIKSITVEEQGERYSLRPSRMGNIIIEKT